MKTFIGLQVIEYSEKSLLMRRFKRSGVWTLPMISFDGELPKDPMRYLDKILSTIINFKSRNSIKIMSLIPVLSDSRLINMRNGRSGLPEVVRHDIKVYNLEYTGYLRSTEVLGPDSEYYDLSVWFPLADINNLGLTNELTVDYRKSTDFKKLSKRRYK